MKILLPILPVVLSLAFISCSTRKNTRMSRSYHNLTAHYNVYFNGNESFKAGVQKVRDNVNNDYSELLPLFEYSKKENVSAASADMDRAIQKGTILIVKHSITKKPEKKGSDGNAAYKKFYDQKEFNKWVDDAYLLIAKSYLYKHDFNQSIMTLDRVIRDFPNSKAQSEAILWKAIAYCQKEDYSNAQLAIESYDKTGNAPLSLYKQYMAVRADILIRQKKYAEAVPFLKNALTKVTDKWEKRRFQYVLAQLLELSHQKEEAQKAYLEVIRLRPPYEMAFNARVAALTLTTEDASPEDTKKSIRHLIRDKKNLEYRDRLYYALAKVNLSENEESQAIENLKRSTSLSTTNQKQKALSFIQLGDIYFSRPEYRPAYIAYDSAMAFIPQSDERYMSLSEKHNSLNALVSNIEVIEREDSLQKIARMPENMRLAFIDKMIEDEQKRLEEERKKAEEEANDSYLPNQDFADYSEPQTGSNWYFYNLTTVNMGKSEFERKWGKRKLEDNWRRTNKNFVAQEQEANVENEPEGFLEVSGAVTPQTSESNPKDSESGNPSSREALLKDIPLTEEAIAKSNEQIETALFEMGMVYRNRLNDLNRAAETFETLLTRFPLGQRREDALIELYQVYASMNHSQGMETTRNRITSEFPDSKFTSFLNDPDFFGKLEQVRKEQEQFYEQTYINYLSGWYGQVIDRASAIDSSKTESALLPKYSLLKALSYAKLGNGELFQSELEQIQAHYSETEEAELAKRFLTEISKGRMPVKSAPSDQPSVVTLDPSRASASDENSALNYTFTPELPHSLIVYVNEQTDMKRLLFNIADFNFGRFLLNDYDLLTHSLPDKSKILEVKGFAKQIEAMDYFYSIRQNPALFDVKNIGEPKLMVVNEENLKFIVSSGDITGYIPFFIDQYLLAGLKKDQQPIDSLKSEISYIQPVKVILDDPKKEESSETSNSAPADAYTMDQGSFLVVLIYEGARVNHERLKNMLAGFNRNQLSGEQPQLELRDFSATQKMVLIDGFDSRQSAEAYIASVTNSSFVLRDLQNKAHQMIVITPLNLERLIIQGDVNEYIQFYNSKQP